MFHEMSGIMRTISEVGFGLLFLFGAIANLALAALLALLALSH